MSINESIFVSIAAYRDKHTIATILDCINQAKNKDNIFFGIVLQDEVGNLNTEQLQNKDNIRIDYYDWRESRGVCWARNKIQQSLLQNEKYYLQIDSHHKFCKNWDYILIDIFKELSCKYQKPIISSYCPPYDPVRNYLDEYPYKINCSPQFGIKGELVFTSKKIKNFQDLLNKKQKYIRGRFLSGHFLFTDANFCHTCPYDPHIYFTGEELAISARAYTSGYDFFHPTKPIIWHYYSRPNEPKHWNDHIKDNGFITTSEYIDNESKSRVRALLGMDITPINFGKYGLGNERSLHEYELYSGLDFKSRRIHRQAYDIKNKYLEPTIMKEIEWNAGMMKSYKIELELDHKILSLLKTGNHTATISMKNMAGANVYRKNIDRYTIGNVNTNKIIFESNMDETPSNVVITVNTQIPTKIITKNFKIFT